MEIGDWSRFSGSSIGAYVGLVPSEFSSGTSRVQGSITKAGNTHVRRLLIEAAWHHRKSYSTSGPTPAGALGQGGPRAARPRSRRQPAPLRRWRGFTEREEEPPGGQRRGRARVVWLVLVAGHDVSAQPKTWLAG